MSLGFGDLLLLGGLAALGALLGLMSLPLTGPFALLLAGALACAMVLGPGHLLYRKRLPVRAPACPVCGQRAGMAFEVPGEAVRLVRCGGCDALVELRMWPDPAEPRPDIAVLERGFPAWAGIFQVQRPPPQD
ncbi:MAG: hypothetical protein VX899_13855 [Myxococcota bacterium]|nr:hypothetical protein [Myxococcota bacterium]